MQPLPLQSPGQIAAVTHIDPKGPGSCHKETLRCCVQHGLASPAARSLWNITLLGHPSSSFILGAGRCSREGTQCLDSARLKMERHCGLCFQSSLRLTALPSQFLMGEMPEAAAS